MIRVCIEKASGKLIEHQTGKAPLGTLTQNAINAGYKADEVEEKYVTGAELKLLLDAFPKPANPDKDAFSLLDTDAKRIAFIAKKLGLL
jgi:hypothetical protein